MERDWELGTGDWGDGEMWGERGERFFPTPPTPPTPPTLPACPMPKNCAAIRSKGQSHISHDLDKLDSVSLQ
ncbi:hypothetical protein H6G98_13895 [Nostoc sp. FACHB-857]|nr:hypothetical protein [Nostoc sp. FACHB-857]